MTEDQWIDEEEEYQRDILISTIEEKTADNEIELSDLHSKMSTMDLQTLCINIKRFTLRRKKW